MNQRYPFENLPLHYGYDALEPYIDGQTMRLHHDRHLQTYIDNLNTVLKKCPELQGKTLEQLICVSRRLPKETGIPIAHNAGGVFNHRFYFDGMSPCTGSGPHSSLAEAINIAFGNFDSFKKKFTEEALSVFGSGYAWLAKNTDGKLCIVTSANQETTLECGLCPILNSDVWEHAYYLKHFNKRADYLEDWFCVVNWNEAERRYLRQRIRGVMY